MIFVSFVGIVIFLVYNAHEGSCGCLGAHRWVGAYQRKLLTFSPKNVEAKSGTSYSPSGKKIFGAFSGHLIILPFFRPFLKILGLFNILWWQWIFHPIIPEDLIIIVFP